MGSRRTDLVSESFDAAPRWLRWPLRASLSILKVARVLIALQAVGGAVGVVVGAATLNGTLVAAGLGQLVLAGVVLGLSLGSEQVVEASGSAGAFIIRTGPHRQWKDERGLARFAAFVMGHRTWRASVRTRAEDPFGKPVVTAEAASEREALALAQDLGARIRVGEDPTAAASEPAGSDGPRK